MLTSTVENYLKAIHRLGEESDGEVTVGGIAKELSVTPGTVTTMMRHLSDQDFVDYAPRRGVKLSETGQEAALGVVRRHRLVELFLVQVMKLDWSEVHEEAEILEHVISDRLIDRIDQMLGYPTHDPHGDPIPDKDGNIAPQRWLSLSEVGAGEYRVVRVSDDDPDLLEWLDRRELNLGARFVLSDSDKAAGVVEIKVEGKESPIQLGGDALARIFVSEVH